MTRDEDVMQQHKAVTPPRTLMILGVTMAVVLLCVAVGIYRSSAASGSDQPIPRINFTVGEGENYTSFYKGEPVGPPDSRFEIHSSPAVLLRWDTPQQSQELQQAFISRNGEFIGTLDIESGKNELLVDAESIELRGPEPFSGFRSGEEYLISLGTKNRPLPPDTDESLKPKNRLYVHVN